VLVVYESAIYSGAASAWQAQEARYAGEALGLTPKAMAALGWGITESDRRAARGAAADLPESLSWPPGPDDPPWWDGDVQPHGLERFHAHRRHKAACAVFLSTLTVKPSGVGLDEWLHAHGLSRLDLGSAAARAIGA
jgi:hypothetical protein